MELWSAFTLGLIGSLHCAGMCGPLAMAVPVIGKGRRAIIASRLIYNAGRIATYGVLGMLFGSIGQIFALAGYQRWISIAAGALILIGLLLSLRWNTGTWVTRWIMRLKEVFSIVFRQRTTKSVFILGLVNGLLPCGLVYVAGAAAIAAGSWQSGGLYMLLFGMGTLPMMFGIGLFAGNLPHRWRMRMQQLVPASLAVVGGLLILRGAGLGIPLLSPPPLETGQACEACEALSPPARTSLP
jgi:uncharacterized protein